MYVQSADWPMDSNINTGHFLCNADISTCMMFYRWYLCNYFLDSYTSCWMLQFNGKIVSPETTLVIMIPSVPRGLQDSCSVPNKYRMHRSLNSTTFVSWTDLQWMAHWSVRRSKQMYGQTYPFSTWPLVPYFHWLCLCSWQLGWRSYRGLLCQYVTWWSLCRTAL